MKNFFNFKMKKLPVILCGTLVALFAACGDDNGSPENLLDDSDVTESSSSAKKKTSSSSLEAIVDINEGSLNGADSIDVSEFDQEESVVDDRNKKTYEHIVSGLNVWMAENLDFQTAGNSSECYDYTDSLCVKHGRLYLNADRNVCPEGYVLPRAADFRLLLESKDKYQLQYAGSCSYQRSEPLECTGISDSAYYITADDSIVAISKKGAWSLMKEDSRFVSVRCLKRKTIVDKFKDLPKCIGGYEGRTVFVAENDSAYTCKDSAWVYKEKYSACENGEKYVAKGKTDVLYACTQGSWHVAGLDDIGRPCYNENRHKDVVMNGSRYACTDSGWTALQYPDSELGECYSGIFWTVSKTDSNRVFVCKNTGLWQPATARDVYGNCVDSLSGSIVKVDTVNYFCSTKHARNSSGDFVWFSDEMGVHSVLGFCTDENVKDTAIYSDQYYICNDKNTWEYEENTKVIGPCDSTRWDTSVFVGHREYLCNKRNKKWENVTHLYFEGMKDSVGCTPKNHGEMYGLNENYKSICAIDNKNMFGFRRATDIELKYGGCGLDTVYSIMDDTTYYSCKTGFWSKTRLNICEMEFGLCKEDMRMVDHVGDSLCYCNGKYWNRRKIESVEPEFKYCIEDTTYTIFKGDSTYKCSKGFMTRTESFSYHYDQVLGKCDKDMYGTDTVYYGQKFVCRDDLSSDGWYRYKETDSLAGSHCNTDILGKEVTTRDSVHYKCEKNYYKYYVWLVQDYSDYMPQCVLSKEGEIISNGVTRSRCDKGAWVPADTFHVKDKRDGKEYAAITIGGKTWMAEPLAYVPEGKRVYVSGKTKPVEELEPGEVAFYPWVVAMGVDDKYELKYVGGTIGKRGICMEGWHVPSDNEARNMMRFFSKRYSSYSAAFGDNDIIGIHFVKRDFVHIEVDRETGEHTVSLDATPPKYDYIWTTSEGSTTLLGTNVTVADSYYFGETSYGLDDFFKSNAMTVRCVKDD